MDSFKILSLSLVIIVIITLATGTIYQEKTFASNGFLEKKSNQIERLKSLQEKLVVFREIIKIETLNYQEIESPLNDIEKRIITLKKQLRWEVEIYNTALCLEKESVIILGSKTCPACLNFINENGGFEALDPIYIECSDNFAFCRNKMKTGRVPEIQINDDVYQGDKNIDSIAKKVGCKN